MDSDCTGGRRAMQFNTASQSENCFINDNPIKSLQHIHYELSAHRGSSDDFVTGSYLFRMR